MQQDIFDHVVYKKFPMAINARNASVHFLGLLRQKHQFDISKMLMATSLCSDEINNENAAFFSMVRGPFVMGGLGGFPFVGLTGMAAFAHHIPVDGSALIFYGPHLGLTHDGTTGLIPRYGHKEPGKSCGALMHVLETLKSADQQPAESEEDYQRFFLEKSLFPYRDDILQDPDPAVRITEHAFELIDGHIHDYLQKTSHEFQVEKIALLGGIIINAGPGTSDYFVPRNFEIVMMG